MNCSIQNLLGLVALVAGSLGALPSMAAACKNVEFSFVNGQADAIEVRAVKYYNLTDGVWRTEDVGNTACNPGDVCATNGDDLDNSSGDDLSRIQFKYFKLRSGGWAGPYWSVQFVPASYGCIANRTYGAYTIQ